MEIKKSRQIIEDMLDLCRQLGDENLSNACEGIFNDTQAADNIEDLIVSARELMIFIGEAPWADFDMDDVRDEIERMFEKMMEEFEDF